MTVSLQENILEQIQGRLPAWNIFKILLLSCLLAQFFGLLFTVVTTSDFLFITAARAISGTFLVLLAPGWLFLSFLDYQTEDLSILSILVPVTSLALTSLTLFVWFFGFTALGLKSPLSQTNIFIALSVLLLGVYTLNNRKSTSSTLYAGKFDLTARDPASITALLAFSAAIFGARLTTAEVPHANLVLVTALLFAAAVPLFLTVIKTSSTNQVLTIYITALALLFHMSLISDWVWGPDIQWTLQFASLITEMDTWPLSTVHRRAPLITVTFVPAALSELTGLTLDWIYKIHLQLLMALMPVGIYAVTKKRFRTEWAVLAPFGYIFYQRFIHGIQAKQHIGQIFIIALVIVLLYEYKEDWRNVVLLLLGWGLVTSHYLMSLIFISMLATYLIGQTVLRVLPPVAPTPRLRFGLSFLVLLPIHFVYWYSEVGGGYIFSQIVILPYRIVTNFGQKTSGTMDRTGESLLVQTLQMGTVRKIYFSLFALLIGFLALGALISGVRTLFKKTSEDWAVYTLLCIPAVGLFTFSIVLKGRFGIDRAMDVMFLIASPLTIAGAWWLARGFERISAPFRQLHVRQFLAVILAFFLLFNLGVAHFALGLPTNPTPAPESFALNQDKPWGQFNKQELDAGTWTLKYQGEDATLYSGNYGALVIGRHQNRWSNPAIGTYPEYFNSTNSTLYIRNYNVPICQDGTKVTCLARPNAGIKIYTSNHSAVYKKG